jgi:hypothetical protein
MGRRKGTYLGLTPAREMDPDVLEEGIVMDSPTIIRIVAGVLFVIVLVVLIQRRRTQVK